MKWTWVDRITFYFIIPVDIIMLLVLFFGTRPLNIFRIFIDEPFFTGMFITGLIGCYLGYRLGLTQKKKKTLANNHPPENGDVLENKKDGG